MISKNNLFFFEDNDSFSSIHEIFQKISENEKNIMSKLWENDKSSITPIIKLLSNYNYELLNNKEAQNILSLLKKEENHLKIKENDIYEQRFYLFFALLDFIERKNIKHSFNYSLCDSIYIGSFEGEFYNELNSIQMVCDCNVFSFYIDEGKRKPTFNFNDEWKKVAQKIGRSFICDMELKEYSSFIRKYEKFRNSILG
ncbi:hypothetical protein ACTOJ1_001205 [Shigella flexneri]